MAEWATAYYYLANWKAKVQLSRNLLNFFADFGLLDRILIDWLPEGKIVLKGWKEQVFRGE